MLIENLVYSSCLKIVCALCVLLHTPVLLFVFHSLFKWIEGEHNCWGHLGYLMPLRLILNMFSSWSLLFICLLKITKQNNFDLLRRTQTFDGNTFWHSMFFLCSPSKWDFIYYVLLCLRVCSKQIGNRCHELKCRTHTIKKHITLVATVKMMLLICITKQYRWCISDYNTTQETLLEIHYMGIHHMLLFLSEGCSSSFEWDHSTGAENMKLSLLPEQASSTVALPDQFLSAGRFGILFLIHPLLSYLTRRLYYGY